MHNREMPANVLNEKQKQKNRKEKKLNYKSANV